MVRFSGLCAVFCFFLIASSAKNCTKKDYAEQILPCNPRTRTRSVVYYLNSTTCSGGEFPPKPEHNIPCTCPPGKGLAGDKPALHKCAPCAKGEYGSGGEIINNWRDWTNNGRKPPEGSGLVTYCEVSRDYVKRCESWKASADNYTLESGDNGLSRCMVSVLLITKRFFTDDSKVSFDYRVDSRECRSGYYGCDGLGFLIDGREVLSYSGNQFHWTSKTYNLSAGTHMLKWIFRKRCFSFGSYTFLDKAFIRSITLVGTVEPNVKCKPCPPGHFNDQNGSSNCTACSYFQFQAKEGQQKCEPCPENTFAMLGASKCIRLRNCTDDDIITAPGNVSGCLCDNNGTCTTTVQPKFVTVTIKGGKGSKVLCNRQKMATPKSKSMQCRCQPGFEISQVAEEKPQCKRCSTGMFSAGVKCAKCKPGYVALPGKHFFVWRNDTLPEGFTASCSGDCTIKTGWIPAGNAIRTERVVGDVHAELRSPVVEVDSELAKIVFNCSVTCTLTGLPSKPARSGNLAKIQDCNLVFQLWSNGSLQDQRNCSHPKGSYGYGHEKRRDGRIITHVYKLKKGSYSFRWVFHQEDDTRSFSSAFEAKVSHISILGAKLGEARNCTACPSGYRNTPDNTDCTICPNGTSSSAGSETCTPCKGETFASQMGSGTCLPCGRNTTALPNKDGCDPHGCIFKPAPGVEYDLNALSRPGGPMIKVFLPRQFPWRQMRSSIIWPYRSYFVNLCTVDHDNSSCTSLDLVTGRKVPLPVMACKSSWYRDESIGSVIGYKAKQNVRSGLIVELLHGDKCRYRGALVHYKTTIDLRCDITAGVGSPGPESNFSVIERVCDVFLVWKSLYACPKCRKQDVTQIRGECINGTRNITILRSIPCWGHGDYPGANVTTEKCVTPTKLVTKILPITVPVTVPVTATVLAYRDKGTSNVNKILIGVGVAVVVLLLGVTLFFVYKHRVVKYRYLTWMSRDKPMSRLEQEDDEDHFIESDELAHTSNDTADTFKT